MSNIYKLMSLDTNMVSIYPHFAETVKDGKMNRCIAMFEDPSVKPLIEIASHIYDSTVISSYF